MTTAAAAPPPAATRAALLAAAGEVFAEHGYHAATVRDICRRAGANVAAVNYHFGDKERLTSRSCATPWPAPTPGTPSTAAPTPPPRPERLRAFIFHFLGRFLDTHAESWLGRLMAKEMIDPSPALDLMIVERIQPMAEQLRAIVRAIVGPDCPEESLRLCGFSIVSQCLFYNHCRSVVTRLFPDRPLSPPPLDRLADHITQFSLAALQHLPLHRPRPLPARRRTSPKSPARTQTPRRPSPHRV
ncbi:MAG: CerR family C-terminal domain-containing protein [Verrucomicrobiales bacterium]|nr:CerR family C-terminal domain-containing protein [Verrucomicrobiales bacterium]